jgi:hypothetical protein
VSLRRAGLLVFLAGAAVVASSPWSAGAQGETDPGARGAAQVAVVLVDDITLPALLEIPEMHAIAGGGGAALMTHAGEPADLLRRALAPGGPLARTPTDVVGPMSPGDVAGVLRLIPDTVDLMVLGNKPSPQMLTAKDDLLPVVVAPAGSEAGSLALGALTSDSTRRMGVVVEEDLVPTILEAQGREVPVGAIGSPMRVVEEPPPLHLYEKHLANRRMSVPIQTAAGIYVGIAGLLGVLVLYTRRRSPRWLKVLAAWGTMSVPFLAIALLAAGRLPTLSYMTVVPFLVAVTVLGTLAFEPMRRQDVLLVPASIGVAVLASFVVEAIFDWSAALTPFLGGSELDGGRFFGLPNVYVGLLLGASLYVAQRHGLAWGAALVAAVALFAGIPGAGANIGGALTLLAAAAIWVAVRAHARLGWARTVAIGGAIVVGGMAVVFASHEFLTATPTHASRFVDGAARSSSGLLETLTHRLGVGFDLIARNPFALLPVFGTVACLLVVRRPPPSIAASFGRHPAWRDAILTILLGSVVAYVANDSGAAALGLGFGLAIGGLLFVPLCEEAGNMEAA